MLKASRAIVSINALLGGVILASWFVIDPLKYILVALLESGTPPGHAVVQTIKQIGIFEWVFLGAVGALGLSMVYSEIRYKALSKAVAGISQRAFWLTFLSVLSFLSHSYLIKGDVVGGDASSHISRIAHASYGFASGKVPSWDNFYYAGSTFLEFTGPLYFWVGGLLSVAIGDPTITTKVLLFAGSILSGVFFFFCMREHGLGRYGAAIGGAVYAGAYAHLHELLIDGNHPQVLTLMFAPLSVLFLHRFLSAGGKKNWFMLTLINIGLLVNHQSMGKQFGVMLIFYSIIYLIGHRERLARLWGLSASALASILGASAVIVPILLEREWVMMYNNPRLLDFEIPSLGYFAAMFSWNLSVREGGKYLGMVAAIFCLAAIIKMVRSQKLKGDTLLTLAVFLCLGLSFFLRGSHVKHIVVTLFFFSFLTAVGADVLRDRLGGTWTLVVLTVLLFLDLGSTSFQPINRTDKQYLHAAGRHLERARPGMRVLNTQTWRDPEEIFASIGPGASITSYYKVPHATGAHSLAATRIHNYLAVAIKDAESELNAFGRLGKKGSRELCLFNIGLLVNDNGEEMGFPRRVETNVSDPLLGRAVRLENCSPVIFSEKLRYLKKTSPFDKPVLWNEQFEQPNEQIKELREFMASSMKDMQYSPERGTAEFLYVREGAGAMKPAGEGEGKSGGVPIVSRYREDMTSLRMNVRAPSKGFVQIANSWYPTLVARRNQELVKVYPGFQYSTVVPVVEGNNEIELIYTRSKQRTVWMMISLSVVVALGLLYWVALRRQNGLEGTKAR
jgi:hypothetical protein